MIISSIRYGLFALALIFALVAKAPRAFAQDVYNFYFQKSQGPQTVIQGGASPSSTIPAGSEATPQSPTAPAPAPSAPAAMSNMMASSSLAPVEPPFKHWQLNAGVGFIADPGGDFSGYTFGGEYNFNKYIGLQAQAVYGARLKQHFSNSINAPDDQSLSYNEDREKRLEYALGAAVTPIHIDLFGWNFLDLSVLGGVMSTRRNDASHGDFMNESSGGKRRIAPYLGAGIDLKFGRTVAWSTHVKVQDDSRYGQIGSSLAFHF